MISLKVICFVYLLNFVICDGQKIQCPPLISDPSLNSIYLLQNNYDDNHLQLNKKFKKMLDPRLDIKIISPKDPECQIAIEEMIQHAENGILIINIYAQDFSNYNLNRLGESLAYIKYNKNINSFNKTIEVCKTNNETNTEGYETCTPFKMTLEVRTIKFASHAIEEKNEVIFKAVLEFEGDFIQQKVVDCRSASEDTCEIGEDVVVAIAPRFDYIEAPTNTTIIFYEESYLSPKTKEHFPNAIVGVNKDTMKNGLLFFLQRVEWKRIAIITDDIEENRDFEEQLTPYLRENGIVIISQICKTKNCNFNEIFKTLDDFDIKIIIANVDQNNSRLLRSSSMYLHSKKRWIVRDWSTSTTEVHEVARDLGDIFVISSSIGIWRNHTHAINAVKRLMKLRKFCKYCEYTNSEVATELRKTLPSSTSYKFTKITKDSAPTVIGSVTFKNENIITEYFPYKTHVADANCVMKTGRIHDPCDDMNLLFLLMIVAVFFITVLGIVYFFQSPMVSYQRFS